MVKIERLPSGSYRARVHLGGGKYKSITGKDKKAVQLEAAQMEAEIEAQKNQKSKPANPYAEMTLGEAMDKYISLKNAILSPSTIRGYDAIRRTRAPMLTAMRLSDITQEDVQRAINEDAVSHSPKSVRNLHSFLSAVLDVYKHDLHLDTTLPQRVKTHIDIPTQAEVDRLFEYFSGSEMEIPFSLAACCGLRESEICGLKWEHVDLERGKIEICEAIVPDKDGNYVVKGTKSESGQRTIRIYPYIREALERAERTNGHLTRLTPRTIYARFKAALKQLGMPDYRFHDLRHYLVSVMLSLNIPKSYIADYVGHADEAMIDRVYGHIMAERKTSIEDIMDEYFRKSATNSATDLQKS
jgi:integrase